MARDESLLEELIDDAEALSIVRVYHWDRPSVSIGRLQDERAVAEAFPGLTAIRRPTGGLAVVHGADVTISVVVRDCHLAPTERRGVLYSYRQIVAIVVEALSCIGVAAALGGAERLVGRTDTVDCFALAARCDVVAEDGARKLAGCAQRRRQGVVLQQMSIPRHNLPDEQGFIKALKDGFTRKMGVEEWVSVDTPTPV